MGIDEDQLRQQYREAVRLHLWYKGSSFSYHKSKTSRELAERYRKVFHEVMGQIEELRRAN